MADILKFDGTPCLTSPRALKLRLADVYRTPEQTAAQIMAEMSLLTDKDMADFRQWFNDAGYPVLP